MGVEASVFDWTLSTSPDWSRRHSISISGAEEARTGDGVEGDTKYPAELSPTTSTPPPTGQRI